MIHPAGHLPREVAYERAERAMSNAAAVLPLALRQATTGVVLVLDIAGMGQVNTRYGVRVGDRVLSDVEVALEQFFGSMGCVSRLPGDQFVVILPDCLESDRAVLSARKAVAQVRVRGRWRRWIAVETHVGAASWNDERSRRLVLLAAAAGLKSASDYGPHESWRTPRHGLTSGSSSE